MSTIDEIKEEFEHAVKLGRKNRGNIVGLLFAEIDRLTKENTDLTASLKKAEVVIAHGEDFKSSYSALVLAKIASIKAMPVNDARATLDELNILAGTVTEKFNSLAKAIADYRKEIHAQD